MASAILHVARELIGLTPSWSGQLECLTGHKIEEIREPAMNILRVLNTITLSDEPIKMDEIFPLLSKLPFKVTLEGAIVPKSIGGGGSDSLMTPQTFSPAAKNGKKKFFLNPLKKVSSKNASMPVTPTSAKAPLATIATSGFAPPLDTSIASPAPTHPKLVNFFPNR